MKGREKRREKVCKCIKWISLVSKVSKINIFI